MNAKEKTDAGWSDFQLIALALLLFASLSRRALLIKEIP